MKRQLVSALLCVSMVTGCSSIVSKTDYPVVIASKPDQAKFVITNRNGQGVFSGSTPATVVLKASSGYFKGESYTVVFSHEGYPDQTHTLTSSVDGWYFGNILIGGLIGMLIVDPATGAMYKLAPRVDAAFDTSVTQESADTLQITTITSLSADQIMALEKL